MQVQHLPAFTGKRNHYLFLWRNTWGPSPPTQHLGPWELEIQAKKAFSPLSLIFFPLRPTLSPISCPGISWCDSQCEHLTPSEEDLPPPTGACFCFKFGRMLAPDIFMGFCVFPSLGCSRCKLAKAHSQMVLRNPSDLMCFIYLPIVLSLPPITMNNDTYIHTQTHGCCYGLNVYSLQFKSPNSQRYNVWKWDLWKAIRFR